MSHTFRPNHSDEPFGDLYSLFDCSYSMIDYRISARILEKLLRALAFRSAESRSMLSHRPTIVEL